jgi:acetyltransferase-like isoleucine patch superfamily enzyme
MNLEQFNSRIKADNYVRAGSDLHEFMIEAAEDAMKEITCMTRIYNGPGGRRKSISRIIGKKVDGSVTIVLPFHTDFGLNITLGKDVSIDSGCCFQDAGGITIGDGTRIGPQVVITTVNRDEDPGRRGDMVLAPVAIGKNVWIGPHATILPGVTVGDGAIIAAGAVVDEDVGERTMVGGVPARLVKKV